MILPVSFEGRVLFIRAEVTSKTPEAHSWMTAHQLDIRRQLSEALRQIVDTADHDDYTKGPR